MAAPPLAGGSFAKNFVGAVIAYICDTKRPEVVSNQEKGEGSRQDYFGTLLAP